MIRRNYSLFAAFVILLGLHTAPALRSILTRCCPILLEERARDISQGLRCLVCQNQSIDDSDADLARDLRILVRERLVAGDTNEEVVDYIVERYGDYVLLNPPLKPETYILWISPAVLAFLALIAVIAFYRRKQREDGAGPKSLSNQEQKRLDEILGTSQDRS